MNKLCFLSGRGQWSKIAPPHSYINTDDFPSPAALAQYLHYLDKNPEEYLSYFWWTDHYYFSRSAPAKHLEAVCQLCKKLNDPEEARRSVDLEKWWWEQSECREHGWWPPPPAYAV